MRRWSCLILGLFLNLLFFSISKATVVPDIGNTDWQTFSYTFHNDFTGRLVFIISDYDDNWVSSYLLVDNIKINNIVIEPNGSFESGFIGFSIDGIGNIVTEWEYGPTVYNPREGNFFAVLDSYDGDTGIDTSFWGGTDGTELATTIHNFNTGDTLSFDWAFATDDYNPYYDFAIFALLDESGTVFQSWKLAQVAAPVPSSLLLFGSGLIGTFAFIKRKKKVI